MKKNMRRYIATGMAALALAGSLAGCGGNSEELKALQAENEQLKALQEENEQLKTSLEQISESVESVESNAAAALTEVENKLMAQSLLIAAQNAFIDYDADKVDAAMAAVEPYLNYLEGQDLNAYYMILEYMEQPYLGTDTEMP